MINHEADDIELAHELLFSPCGLVLEKIPERAGISKTPDFRVLSWGGLSGYCELKSPVGDGWLEKKIANAKPGQIVGGVRHDPNFNRLARHIRNAVDQFDAVNPVREVPNILVFVNHDPMSVPPDLYETITGRFPAHDGSRCPTVPYVANRLSNSIPRIDLCAWIDARQRKLENLLFVGSQPDYTARLKELLRAVRHP